MSDRRKLLAGIAQKLPLLLGGALAVSYAHGVTMTPAPTTSTRYASPVGDAASRPAPPKLILKQRANGDGFRLIAQHGSHSSHASHASHASHSSHSSRAI